MKTDRSILIAFLMNFVFSIFEFLGGIFTGSTAILSDAVHDMGDAASIGISWFLERKSKKAADSKFTYGYSRYSVVGSIFTLLILIVGSVCIIFGAVLRIFEPKEINYDGMLIFAVVGIIINLVAVIFTRHGDSLNQKAVNLHMLEDVLGWIVVFIGALIMRFTDIAVLDPILSILVAVFILVSSLPGLKTAIDVILDKAPQNIDISELSSHLTAVSGVLEVHHIHVRSMDGNIVCASLHAVVNGESREIKNNIKGVLKEHGINHATVELETPDESCPDRSCIVQIPTPPHSCPHHHSHHS